MESTLSWKIHIEQTAYNFTLSIPFITMQLLQFKPTNAHICIALPYYYNNHKLLHVSSLTGPSSVSSTNCV